MLLPFLRSLRVDRTMMLGNRQRWNTGDQNHEDSTTTATQVSGSWGLKQDRHRRCPKTALQGQGLLILKWENPETSIAEKINWDLGSFVCLSSATKSMWPWISWSWWPTTKAFPLARFQRTVNPRKCLKYNTKIMKRGQQSLNTLNKLGRILEASLD